MFIRRHQRSIFGLLGTLIALVALVIPLPVSGAPSDPVISNLQAARPFKELPTSAPDIATPDWYDDVVIYYSVVQDGPTSDLATFASLANETLNDPRGWSRLGVRFVEVSSGGSFRLILAEASRLPTYSSGCSAEWSCNVGNSVIINDTRWTGASSSWNAAGGSLRDYRHMVVNHETGHWLGHGHESCGGAGSKAPVMQQQSIDLMGCSFNPWPLASELWTSRF